MALGSYNDIAMFAKTGSVIEIFDLESREAGMDQRD